VINSQDVSDVGGDEQDSGAQKTARIKPFLSGESNHRG
jgi:hypothetical protein